MRMLRKHHSLHYEIKCAKHHSILFCMKHDVIYDKLIEYISFFPQISPLLYACSLLSKMRCSPVCVIQPELCHCSALQLEWRSELWWGSFPSHGEWNFPLWVCWRFGPTLAASSPPPCARAVRTPERAPDLRWSETGWVRRKRRQSSCSNHSSCLWTCASSLQPSQSWP